MASQFRLGWHKPATAIEAPAISEDHLLLPAAPERVLEAPHEVDASTNLHAMVVDGIPAEGVLVEVISGSEAVEGQLSCFVLEDSPIRVHCDEAIGVLNLDTREMHNLFRISNRGVTLFHLKIFSSSLVHQRIDRTSEISVSCLTEFPPCLPPSPQHFGWYLLQLEQGSISQVLWCFGVLCNTFVYISWWYRTHDVCVSVCNEAVSRNDLGCCR